VGTQRAAHVIVLGNEKGGSGKTTVTMHLVVALLRLGFRVASIDLDSRQRSLTRYVENRRYWADDNGVRLPLPEHRLIGRSQNEQASWAVAEDEEALRNALNEFRPHYDYVLVDCPGSDQPLARFAHNFADTLVTPINDSFIDLDLLVELRPGTFEVMDLGVYMKMVWEQRQDRRRARQPGFDWIVLRNRLSGLADRNKRSLAETLEKIAPLLGFRVAGGLGERVIFREMFTRGVTVFDIGTDGVDVTPTKSHAAAREEVRALLHCLWLPAVEAKLPAL
jgi:chromosome partitioning protein